MITIVDYGMGNLGSIANMFKRIGADSVITSEPDAIADAKKIVLPGVGAFDSAMQRLTESGLAPVLKAQAHEEEKPILGICLGMQLLTSSSEEGKLPGLSIIPGIARRFPRDEALKVPHMGWNVVKRAASSPLTDWMSDKEETRFYFTHSYAVETERPEDTILTCDYGLRFAAGIARGTVYGAQFHPEKSHRFGMRLLQAFADLPC